MTRDAEALARPGRAPPRNGATARRRPRPRLPGRGRRLHLSTFRHLARAVRELAPEIEVETIAGSAPSPPQRRWPTWRWPKDETDGGDPAAYGTTVIDHLLDEFDTLVLMKVKPLLDEVIELLERRGLLATSCFIENPAPAATRGSAMSPACAARRSITCPAAGEQNPKAQARELRQGCRCGNTRPGRRCTPWKQRSQTAWKAHRDRWAPPQAGHAPRPEAGAPCPDLLPLSARATVRRRDHPPRHRARRCRRLRRFRARACSQRREIRQRRTPPHLAPAPATGQGRRADARAVRSSDGIVAIASLGALWRADRPAPRQGQLTPAWSLPTRPALGDPGAVRPPRRRQRDGRRCRRRSAPLQC